MKQNFIRVIAATMFFASFLVLFYMLSQGFNAALDWDFQDSAFLRAHVPLAFGAVGLLLLLGVFLLLPLLLGIKRWFFEVAEDEQKPMVELFYYFQNAGLYWKAVGFQLQVYLRQFGIYVLCLRPGGVTKVFAEQYASFDTTATGVLYGVIFTISVLLLVSGACLGFYLNLRYFLASFLHFSYPVLTTRRAVTDSAFLMRRRRTEVLTLYISLFPFYLLCMLVLPVFLLVPYVQVLTAVKGREILTAANLHYPNSVQAL